MVPARLLPVLAALVAATPLAAQRPLTLDEAIRIAQDQGHQARQAEATRGAARLRGDAFRARLLPQITLGGNLPAYNRSIIPVLQPDGSTLFRPQQQTNATLTATLTQRLPVTGGDLFVSSALSRLTVSGQQAIETWSSTPVVVGLRQNILRPNTSGWDQREQSVRDTRDERVYREAMEDIAVATTGLFFDVYAAQVALANAENNAAVNDTLYRINTGRFQVGRIGENDLLQSELVLLRAQQAVEGARLNYDRAVAALRLALRLPTGEAFEAVPPTNIPEVAPDPERAVTEAMRNRSTVSDVELQSVQADRRVTEARLNNGIGATVQASIGFNATAPEMNLAYRNLLEAQQFTFSVQVPLWQWGAHGATVEAARMDRERVESQAESTLEQLAHDARFAARQLIQSRRNVELFAKADTVAASRFSVAYNRYVIGRIAIDNLFIAQNEKDQALNQYLQALEGFWTAYYRLRRLTLYDFVRDEPIR